MREISQVLGKELCAQFGAPGQLSVDDSPYGAPVEIYLAGSAAYEAISLTIDVVIYWPFLRQMRQSYGLGD